MACGANYAFQRRFGLGLPRSYLHTAQRELVARHAGDVELHFGHDIAPGGFAWAVPIVRESGTYVRVGVMTSRDPLGGYARMLERVAGRWGIDRYSASRRGRSFCRSAPSIARTPIGRSSSATPPGW